MEEERIDELAARAAAKSAAQVQGVQPAPLPTVFNIGQAEGNGKRFVMLQIATPAGQSVFFLDGASAEGLGENLIRMGVAVKAGLVMP
jgi:hypothetical protein